ncbi:uncharacterized protein LOC105692807 [Athalia rosae]|uniref:uncharacterized protein LOC105692807 n=1 Tax=Athalia rosae TaxID=37344 RepID=UPI00203443AF|nr:uncharacterized protein LOC105692807 [Athalia rosae]XP_048505702.1 uncharacterized protein LOC105692807 [Athalia rosae]
METSIPGWLDATYLQNVLRNYEKDDSVEVTDIIVRPATAKGDHYGSVMYRVASQLSRVKDERKINGQMSLIVKITLSIYDVDHPEIIIDGMPKPFVTELSLLHRVLPKMNEIVEEFYPDATPMSPRCFHVQYENPSHAILEDLATSGFRMADRRSGLDLDHSLLAMRNLGRFHASSIALADREPGVLSPYRKGVFHKDQWMVCELVTSGMKSLAIEAAKWPELSPRVAEKIDNVSEVMFRKACEVCEYDRDEFNVLNHGDLWVNNMMFRYDENDKPVDLTFLDFQVSHLGSPAEDIIHFFGTSISEDVRIHHTDLLLRDYHRSLVGTMKQLKCTTESPSLEDLQGALKKREICGAVVAMTMFPVVILEKGVEVDVSNTMVTDKIRNNPAFRGELYRKVMNRLLPIYDRDGLLDS